MQFKHPEILYFLFLLIIPFLVHLFQLQKFKKTPFTNVAFLQRILVKNRKSSQLKKWLILTLRTLLFTGLIIAFSEPFFSHKNALKNQVTFIYLDNSLSMTAQGKKGELFKSALQDLIENSSKNKSYYLLTNNQFFKNKNASELKNILLNLKTEAKSLSLTSVLLKLNSVENNEINTLYENILISDFQNNKQLKNNLFTNVKQPISLIKLQAEQKSNLSVDSVFINRQNENNFTVNIVVKNQGVAKNEVPISIFDKNILIAKQVFSIKKNETKLLYFPIQNKRLFNGKIEVKNNDAFRFDNTFYFTKNNTQKTPVLSIGKKANYLSKIYTKNEFNFQQIAVQNINYNSLKKQQLIILNELQTIPTLLANVLKKFLAIDGSLVIIPSLQAKISSYNRFFKDLKVGKINQKNQKKLNITNIHYTNPFFNNVFNKKVTNFQYPFVNSSYTSIFKQRNTIVGFENQTDFISKILLNKGKLYWIAAPISNANSNFTNSPLIVPVFYNFGKLSFKNSQLFYSIAQHNTIDITTNIGSDEVLTIKNEHLSFIPQQQINSQKVTLTTFEQPSLSGIYSVLKQTTKLRNIAFNYPKSESTLQFIDLKALIKDNKKITVSNSIAQVFKENRKKNQVTWLWKWFLALAIVSLLFEILILKHFKP